MQVYDDIQTELQEKTAVLKRMKQRVRGLNTEITDLQSEFERDRQVSGDWSQYSALIGPQREYCGQVSFDWWIAYNKQY